MSSRTFIPLWLTLVVVGCQSNTSIPVSPGYDYFPLETSRFIVYDVQEYRYALHAAPTQRLYQRKEVTGPAYRDVTGQMAYRLFCFQRSLDSQPWQVDSVWSVRLVNNEGIRQENGADFVKLVFPVNNRLRWNGNRLNTFGDDEYETRNSGQPYLVQNKQYDETVMVIAQDDSTLVSRDKRMEVYARQIGLIYKEQTHLSYCSSTPACTGTYQIDYGIRKIYRIRTFGTE